MDIILSAKNLSFRNIIKYPDIDIKRGRTVFICGESGCGKSTLLRLLNGTLSADSGEIKYNGETIDSLDTVTLRKEVLLVSQTVFLFDETIKSNFIKFYQYRDLLPPPDEQIKKYLNLCCTQLQLDERCDTMSGGERQRVFIAICLSFLPKVLMLDEPTSALDEKTGRNLLHNIKQFCKENEITLIVVSHDKSLVDAFADEKIMLKRNEN